MGRQPSTVVNLGTVTRFSGQVILHGPQSTATRWTLVLGLLVAVGCGRGLGPDTDGDGLSDRQEDLFGTDPARSDTDCDGLTDGVDTQPLTGAVLSLTRGPVTEDETGTMCAQLEARLSVGGGGILEGRDIVLESDLGDFGPITEEEPAVYRSTLCVDADDAGIAHVKARHDNIGDTCPSVVGQTVAVFIPRDMLPQPGLNTFGERGPIKGLLRVYALDGDTPGTAFEGAYVVVDTGTGTLSGFTDSDGILDFSQAPDLKGPVDVTVTAEGYRATSYFGVDAAIVAVALVRLDPVPGVDDQRVGSVTGKVTGFDGQTGLEKFPAGGSIFDLECVDDISIAIVSVAMRNVPLSSISMGNILEAPDASEGSPIPRPSNMYVHDKPPMDQFRLDGLPDGQHLLFALGGTIRCLLNVMFNPYEMSFRPRALGIKRIDIKGGKTIQEDLEMNIDLLPDQVTGVDVQLGSLPSDWKNGDPLPNGLVFGVMDTGGEGYVFVAVDGAYNMDGFANPITFRFPDVDEPHMKALGLETTNLAVGFGGRGTVQGADPPGIATAITPGVKAGDTVIYDLS